jgi:hypothetical protein
MKTKMNNLQFNMLVDIGAEVCLKIIISKTDERVHGKEIREQFIGEFIDKFKMQGNKIIEV